MIAISRATRCPDTLDAQIVTDAARFLQDGEKMQLQYAVAKHIALHWHKGVEPYCDQIRHAQ